MNLDIRLRKAERRASQNILTLQKKVSEKNILKEEKHQKAIEQQKKNYYARMTFYDKSMMSSQKSLGQTSTSKLHSMHMSQPSFKHSLTEEDENDF